MSQDPTEIDRFVGSRLRLKRKELGLSQAEVSARLDATPIEILSFEEGRKRIPPRQLIRAAETFKVEINWFFEGAPEQELCLEATEARKDLAKFLALPEAIALMRAFLTIQTGKERQDVVEFAQGASRTATAARRR